MRKALLRAAVLAVLVGTMPAPMPAVAAEDCAAIAARAAAAWRAKSVVPGLAGIDAATAACVQKTLVLDLEFDLGRAVGYKVGLTGKAMQERLGVDHPIAGVLLPRMLLDPGTSVPAGYAARPLVEADLIAVIGDAGVNEAKTPAEMLAHLSALRPFIELADLALPPDEKPTAASITAVNVGARLGVLGDPIAIDPGMADRLATMTVSLTDGSGKVLVEAPGTSILGHPLNAVIWLARDLALRGETLRPGQLVSLGAFGPPAQPVPGGTVTVRYDGLSAAPVALSVRFE
ncbi:2-keto-4-pentenoate hydratase [Inquilinus sp.]|jgi:2-keto-4-pentenoate hydratase|uniref:2-keto-4-pentenoate hydratase n=1 Tax=Inquilinus sp. TaxID=1932117 RepID=UPI003783837A